MGQEKRALFTTHSNAASTREETRDEGEQDDMRTTKIQLEESTYKA